MAKKISEVIDDRISDGVDAWKTKIKLASAEDWPEVRDAASWAKSALEQARAALGDISIVRAKCKERDTARGDDRQIDLPGTEGDDGADLDAPALPEHTDGDDVIDADFEERGSDDEQEEE